MIIVKVGGAKNLNWKEIAQDLKEVIKREQVIFVHGASETRDEIAARLGQEVETIVSPSGFESVFTDEKAIDVFLMAYAGLVNKRIVEAFRAEGINAVGLTGADGAIWKAKQKTKILIKEGDKIKARNGNLTGKVKEVNTGFIDLLLKNEYLPVICPPAISDEGRLLNVDNDTSIAVMVENMSVEKVIFLFAAPGMLEDYMDENTKVDNISEGQLEDYYKMAKGTMKKKLLGAKRSIEAGACEIVFSDSRVKKPITKALEGNGTVIA